MIETPSITLPGLWIDIIVYVGGVLSGIFLAVLPYNYQDYIQKKNELNQEVYSPLLDETKSILNNELPYEPGDYQSLRTYRLCWENIDSRLQMRASEDVRKKAKGIVYKLNELGDLEEDVNDIDHPTGMGTSVYDLYRHFSRDFVKSNDGPELSKQLEKSIEDSTRRGWSELIDSLQEEHGDDWPSILLAQVTDRQKSLTDFTDSPDKEPIEQLWDNIYDRRRVYQSVKLRAESLEPLLEKEINRTVFSFIILSIWGKYNRFIPSLPSWKGIKSKLLDWNG
jgi:hypothetical protein